MFVMKTLSRLTGHCGSGSVKNNAFQILIDAKENLEIFLEKNNSGIKMVITKNLEGAFLKCPSVRCMI